MISHNDANPDGNLDDSFNRQNSGNNLLDNSAIGMGGNQPLQSPGGQGGHKPQFNMSDDQIALHDRAAQVGQQVGLLRRFHALGDHL